MTATFAPARLPLAPRSCRDELISSCLLRVAAANGIGLKELLDGFESRYPGCLPHGYLLDCSLPGTTLKSLAFFCRLPLKRFQELDLRRRGSHLDLALLLQFRQASPWCPRGTRHRVGYAFCPRCIAVQAVTYIPWDWSLACLIHCPVHRALLRDGCPACGEPDPLTFTPPGQPPSRVCWSCGADITDCHQTFDVAQKQHTMQTVEDAYRAALLGIAPHRELLGRATARSFRRFVHDLLEILNLTLNSRSFQRGSFKGGTAPIPRWDLLRIITELVLNAAPTSDARQRRSRYARGLVLWATLLKVITEHDAGTIERASQHWPVPLRERYLSALYHRTRKRWPYSPFEGHSLSTQFKCREVAAVYDLSAAIGLPIGKSRI
jgi:hypothetical protein